MSVEKVNELTTTGDQHPRRWLSRKGWKSLAIAIGFLIAMASAFYSGLVQFERLDSAARIVISFGSWQKVTDDRLAALTKILNNEQASSNQCREAVDEMRAYLRKSARSHQHGPEQNRKPMSLFDLFG